MPAWPDPPLEPIHTRQYVVNAYRKGADEILIRGSVQDDKPGDTYVDGDPDPLTMHCMIVDLTVGFPSLQISGVEVVFETYPQAECPRITDHYRSLIGLSVARGFTHNVRELFGGPRGCAHVTALLQAMAPVAVQCRLSMGGADTLDAPVAFRPTPPDRRGSPGHHPGHGQHLPRLGRRWQPGDHRGARRATTAAAAHQSPPAHPRARPRYVAGRGSSQAEDAMSDDLRIEVWRVPSPLPKPVVTAVGLYDTFFHLVVVIQGDGLEGWGYSGMATAGLLDQAAERALGLLDALPPRLDALLTVEHFEQTWPGASSDTAGKGAANAIALAAWDLAGRRIGLPCANLWGRRPATESLDCYGSGFFLDASTRGPGRRGGPLSNARIPTGQDAHRPPGGGGPRSPGDRPGIFSRPRQHRRRRLPQLVATTGPGFRRAGPWLAPLGRGRHPVPRARWDLDRPGARRRRRVTGDDRRP